MEMNQQVSAKRFDQEVIERSSVDGLKQFAGVTPMRLLSTLGLNEPPFNPFVIALHLGLPIDTSYKNDSHSGEINFDPESKEVEVWINPTESIYRQRFTLAHELGHLINDILPNIDKPNFRVGFKDGAMSLRRDGRQDPSEFAANEFAASLLMPINHVGEKAVNVVLGYSNEDGKIPEDLFVNEMCKLFQVSRSAMTVRLKRLGVLS